MRACQIAYWTGQTDQGAAEVAASCVRKDLLVRSRAQGHVYFALTPRGVKLGARPVPVPLACGCQRLLPPTVARQVNGGGEAPCAKHGKTRKAGTP